MDFSSILNQVLNAGQQLTQQNGSSFNPNNQTTSNNDSLPFNLDMLKGFGGGAAATSLLSMLLGNSGLGKGILKLGSVAAIGSMAYSAWKNYQATQQNTQQSHFVAPESRTPEQHQNASQLMLKAMIAAAAADGEIDNSESQALLAQIGSENPEVQSWLQQEIQNPASAQSIAATVGDDMGLATQIYLASRIVCGDLNRHEIIYLHDLATALHLDKALVEKLEAEAGF